MISRTRTLVLSASALVLSVAVLSFSAGDSLAGETALEPVPVATCFIEARADRQAVWDVYARALADCGSLSRGAGDGAARAASLAAESAVMDAEEHLRILDLVLGLEDMLVGADDAIALEVAYHEWHAGDLASREFTAKLEDWQRQPARLAADSRRMVREARVPSK
jgi:hypothetical protein